MNHTLDFSFVRVASSEPELDDLGGLVPEDEERAKAEDVITLPEGVTGTNCGNCLFISKIEDKEYGYCIHPKVDMPVNNRMCCKRWDAPGVKRHFKFTRREEVVNGSEIMAEEGETDSSRKSRNRQGRRSVDTVRADY